jgi:hypothetical protein
MCNIKINLNLKQNLQICRFNSSVDTKIENNSYLWPRRYQPAMEILAYSFALGKAITYPFQNPIKNIICSPE